MAKPSKKNPKRSKFDQQSEELDDALDAIGDAFKVMDSDISSTQVDAVVNQFVKKEPCEELRALGVKDDALGPL